MEERSLSKNNNEELEDMAREIFNLTTILIEYSKNNTDTCETDCLYTGLKILYKKIGELNLKITNC